MYNLKTSRLYLQPLERSHLNTFHQLIIHPDVRRFLCDNQILPQERVASWIEESCALFATNQFGLWAMFPHPRIASQENTLIGFCGLWYFHTPPELELAFGIAPTHWNQGLATEAAQVILRYGFEQLQLDRIAASADAPNAASLRVMQKLGMTEVRRSIANGSELVHYSIAREELC